MTDGDRRQQKNQQLREFFNWIEKSKFYGKFTVTCKNGEVVGAIETIQTHRLEDFGEPATIEGRSGNG